MELGEVMMLIGAVVLMLWITTINVKRGTNDILLTYLLEVGLFFLVIGYIVVYITGIALNLQGKFH